MIYWYWGTERVLGVMWWVWYREMERGVRNGVHTSRENREVCKSCFSTYDQIPNTHMTYFWWHGGPKKRQKNKTLFRLQQELQGLQQWRERERRKSTQICYQSTLKVIICCTFRVPRAPWWVVWRRVWTPLRGYTQPSWRLTPSKFDFATEENQHICVKEPKEARSLTY